MKRYFICALLVGGFFVGSSVAAFADTPVNDGADMQPAFDQQQKDDQASYERLIKQFHLKGFKSTEEFQKDGFVVETKNSRPANETSADDCSDFKIENHGIYVSLTGGSPDSPVTYVIPNNQLQLPKHYKDLVPNAVYLWKSGKDLFVLNNVADAHAGIFKVGSSAIITEEVNKDGQLDPNKMCLLDRVTSNPKSVSDSQSKQIGDAISQIASIMRGHSSAGAAH